MHQVAQSICAHSKRSKTIIMVQIAVETVPICHSAIVLTHRSIHRFVVLKLPVRYSNHAQVQRNVQRTHQYAF